MNNIHVTAKKSLGQNFLVNPHVLDRIIEAGAIVGQDIILEVGPGTGALTERLASTGARIIAIEKDQRLIEPLRLKLPTVDVREADILDFDIAALGVKVGGYKIIANIPYYLTSHLIRNALESWPMPSLMVLMVQEEVARRMMAKPGDMNLLALSVQLYGTPSLIARVSRNSFRPVPDVDSAVVKIEIHPSADRDANERILAIAKKSFGQKRKQLKASIPAETLERAGIAPTARPQDLSVDQWRLLS